MFPPGIRPGDAMNEQNSTVSPVFVSYSRTDAAFASEVVISLECCGFAPKIDQRHLLPGTQWQGEIYKLIERASTMAFVLSSASLASAECQKELVHALNKGKRVIPLVIDEAAVANAPEALRRVQFIRFVGVGRTFAMGIADLVKALRTDIAWVDDHTRYTDRAAEWVTRERPPSHLLPGDALAHALAWLGEPASAGMMVTTEVAEYITASKHAAEEAERRRIEAHALEQIKEQKSKARRRLTSVAIVAAFIILAGGTTAAVLIQNAYATSVRAKIAATEAEANRKGAEATKALAEQKEKFANALSEACPATKMSTKVADIEGAQAKLGGYIETFLSIRSDERRAARISAAAILSTENNAALNRGFFELVTDRARRGSESRYLLLLGMAQTFAEMTVPITMDDPATVKRLLEDLKKAINDKTLQNTIDKAISGLAAPS